MQALFRLNPRLTSCFSQGLTTSALGGLVSVYFILLFNGRFLRAIAQTHGVNGPHDLMFMASVVVLAGLMTHLLVVLPGFRYLYKPWLIMLLVTAASASYFINNYNVIIDRTMIQNILETDRYEAFELMSWKWLAYVGVLGVFPALLLMRIPIRCGVWYREFGNKAAFFGISGVIIALIAWGFFQDYASVLRTNRQVRDLMVPVGYVYAAVSYARHAIPMRSQELVPVGRDARLGERWSTRPSRQVDSVASPRLISTNAVGAPSEVGRKAVTILVVGETARAENFSLNGYGRKTNPLLEQQDVINFPQVSSCGTTTAISVPCMFSDLGRRHYDDATSAYRENLLDVFKHSGLSVLWRDNNSGCKGVCSRVDYEDAATVAEGRFCHDGECFDEGLLADLDQRIDAYDTEGVVVVLHQKGSHGPAYFRRVPERFAVFTPVCHTTQLQQCSQSEIVNAYDNTLIYTDYVLSQLIDYMKARQDRYDTTMIYVSDHGESLSEGNLYLHGMPYSIAPSQQTHVPMLIWVSDGYARRFAVDKDCLARRANQDFSHDNLFHSLLGLMDVQTQVYDRDRDIFAPCRQGPGAGGPQVLNAQSPGPLDGDSADAG